MFCPMPLQIHHHELCGKKIIKLFNDASLEARYYTSKLKQIKMKGGRPYLQNVQIAGKEDSCSMKHLDILEEVVAYTSSRLHTCLKFGLNS